MIGGNFMPLLVWRMFFYAPYERQKSIKDRLVVDNTTIIS
jgi:hypothetical protein